MGAGVVVECLIVPGRQRSEWTCLLICITFRPKNIQNNFTSIPYPTDDNIANPCTHWRIQRGRKERSPPPPKKRGVGERKKWKERKEGISLCVLAFHSNMQENFSCIKHSTDESGFPFITSETIIIIVLLDHIYPSVQFV